MSKERITIPAPPINPSTGELVTYEQFADRFDAIEQNQADMRKATLNGFFELTQRFNADAEERRELLAQVLELAKDNRRRIEALEAWRTDHECEPKTLPNGRSH